MQRILMLVLMLICATANATEFAVRNAGGGMIVITDAPCNLLQIRALYIQEKVSLNQAYTTDKQDNIVKRGCWIVDNQDDEVQIVWDDWANTAISSAGWAELDDLAIE